jgi:hypothetical protein
VHVGGLAHEDGADPLRKRKVDLAPPREQLRRLADSRLNQGIRPLEPGDADLELLQRVEGLGLEAVGEHLEHLLTGADRARHRSRMVEARCEREHAVERHEPVARLEADDPAAGGRNPDRPA